MAADADESELQAEGAKRLHACSEVFVLGVIDLADGSLNSVDFPRNFAECTPKLALLAVRPQVLGKNEVRQC